MYRKLETAFEQSGGRCLVDSAFSKGEYPFLIKSSPDPVTNAADMGEVAVLQQATSAQQASEWGMRALQGSFPRLKDRFVYEERGERKSVLHTIVLLFNLRTRLVGINQILGMYMPALSIEANELLFKI